VNPIHDDRAMHDINIGGLQNVLKAVRRIRPRRFLAASSATVYGARPEHTQPLDETAELHACRKFRYSADKLELERRLVEFEADHPGVAVSWVRPCMVRGPGVDNYLSRLLLHVPFVCLLDGNDTPLQFVHEDDLVAAMWTILSRSGRGAFNIAPPDWVHASDLALESGRRAVKVPYWIVNLVAYAWWHLRLPVFNCPPPLYGYLRDPWIVAPDRLLQEYGFEFQHSSRDTLRELLRANGKLVRVHAAHEPPAPLGLGSPQAALTDSQ
jgi:UDP-glucose 4-epimerase